LAEFSILELAHIPEGRDAGEALRRAVDLAQHAEKWGYRRFWVAEHHNAIGIASAATAVLIGHIAGQTRSIRGGAGGIMLPNHVPLIVAEQFGTLATLYPDRIDLGLGRAAGTAHEATLRALRRDALAPRNFPQDVLELQTFLGPPQPWQTVRAVPGAGLEVPLWLLGASQAGGELAAGMGLPFAFASHFWPDALMPTLQAYRANFKPSRQLDRPYAMPSINVVLADTDAEARHLFTSVQQSFTDAHRGFNTQLRPAIADIESYWTASEKPHAEAMLACSFVGSPASVREDLRQFLAATAADEVIVASAIYEHAARLRSYELLAELRAAL
jgi:luciferase family oxidoreductase group 1